VTKINIDQIVFCKELYPRDELDNENVNAYRDAIEKLPPITLSKDNILIDGYHRLTAHRLEGYTEIEAEILDITDKKEILIEAIRRNTTHGKQLTKKEKHHWAKQMFQQGFDKPRIATELSVSGKSVDRWVKSLEDDQNEEVLTLITDLYLRCFSENEIVDELARNGIEYDRSTVNRKLEAVQKRQLSEMHTPEDLQLYNTWKVFQMPGEQMKYPGQIPEQIIENILYYYSNPNDIVLDPMAGSGIVGDICKRMFRRYWLIDVNPINQLTTKQGDSLLNIVMPIQKKADLVFLDPPYYNLMGDDYPDNGFTKTYDTFLNSMGKIFDNCIKASNEHAKASLILKPMNENLFDGDWLDMSFDCVELAKDVGYKYIKRISAPLSTNQFSGSNVISAKDNKNMLNTLRDILIFEVE